MGFFKLHKPLEYKYRYIYYDPKKEARKEREQSTNTPEQPGEYKRTIQRGTFREMANQRHSIRKSLVMQSNLRLLVIIAILVLLMYFLLK